MSKKSRQAILKTLVYADLFDYPLTIHEIWERLIKVKSSKLKVQSYLKKQDLFQKIGKYWFLKGREKIVEIREKREAWSKKKREKVKEITTLLKFIPTVRLVCITGAVAAGNAKKDDDIDFLIVAKRNSLWLTRFFVTFLLELLGIRRKPGEKNVEDKLCLNMFMDEDYLKISAQERDLYTAYEIVQMKPIFNEFQTYEKFINNNLWIKEFLPNALSGRKELLTRGKKIKKSLISSLTSQLLFFFEIFFQKWQLIYMKKRRTTEVIRKGVIRFHPKDNRKEVLKKYEQRMTSKNIA